jgi:starvation-inducible DNA-binding protein
MAMTSTSRSKAATSPVVESLNLVLADSYALMVNTHHAHWNVEGPSFFELHKAFQQQYEELFTAIDEIAERIRAIDGYAVGGLQAFAKLSGLDEFKAPMDAKDYVAGLVEAHEKTVVDLVSLRDRAEAAKDLETQDLAIGRIQTHQKTLWMLKSFLKH